jgi:transposase
MYCPQLPNEQSLVFGEKRLERAALSLGPDVLQRLIIFVLYILGFNRDLIARLFGYQVSGVKTLVDRVFDNGLEGLYDHRRTGGAAEKKDIVTVTDAEDHKQVNISGAVISVPKHDLLARKIIGVMLAESELLSNNEGAAILDYTPQAFGRLRERYRLKGSAGLIDQRKGQQGDFKVTPDVKAALVYAICQKARDGITFTSKDLCEAINRQFPDSKISERTIRHHLTRLGLLPQLRRELVKKN